MNTPMSPLEKQVIERKLIADEAAKTRKQKFLGRIFAIGLASGVAASVAKWLFAAQMFSAIAFCIWVLCTAIYADLFSTPRAVTPLDALNKLKEAGRQEKAVALFFAPIWGWVISLMAVVVLRMIAAALD
jgi:hypothetical protein